MLATGGNPHPVTQYTKEDSTMDYVDEFSACTFVLVKAYNFDGSDNNDPQAREIAARNRDDIADALEEIFTSGVTEGVTYIDTDEGTVRVVFEAFFDGVTR
jgi:hypothetical protein